MLLVPVIGFEALWNAYGLDVQSNPPSTHVWQYMAKIMLAREGMEDWKATTMDVRRHPSIG